MLETTTPLEVIGDGNCMFRAVSLGLYGNQDHHLQLRLRTALVIALYPEYYDSSREDHQDVVKDNRLIHDPYPKLLSTVATPRSYSETLVIYALSAALSTAIETCCPPTRNAEFLSQPYSRKVCGRGVRRPHEPAVIVVWSSSTLPQRAKDFRPDKGQR